MPQHVVQCGGSREPVFFENADYTAYLSWLKDAALRYRANANGDDNELLTPHALYTALGRTQAQRLAAYKALFKTAIDDEQLNDIRAAWQTGTPLGSDHFKTKIENKLGMNIGQARRGRPIKTIERDE